MGLPGQKRGKTSKRMRAAHFALRRVKLIKCSKCNKPVLPHHVCLNCGTYRGRNVLHLEAKLTKKQQKEKEKQEKTKNKEEKK